MTTRRKPASRGEAPPTAPTGAGAEPVKGFPLGGTGRTHPPIGLGLWALGRWSREDENRTRATADRALARGVRWLDTAEVYGGGRSERVLGEVLAKAGAAAEEVFLTTKLSWEHLRAPQVRPSLQGSLQRLGRAAVDLYLVHAPDSHVPIAETMGALETLYEEGKIRAIGVSNFSLEELERARAALSRAPLVANQVRFNLLEREDAEGILDYCREHRIVVEAYTPLGRGLLAGRYLDGEPPPSEAQRFAESLFEGNRFPEFVARARRIRDRAQAAGVPMASVALHWLHAKGAAPVFGARDPDQLEATLAAWRTVPPPDLLEEADRLARGDRA